jgi:hypothetical protein
VDRLVIVAPLRPGASADAERLIENGPPFDAQELGFDSHGVYLSTDEVVFIFEGAHAKEAVDDLLNDPRLSEAFRRWRALVDRPPRLAQEKYLWARPES